MDRLPEHRGWSEMANVSKLTILAGVLALAAAIWLLLPVKHAPGYTSKSLLSTSAGLWAVPLVLAPVMGVGITALGERYRARGRRGLGLLLVWAGLLPLLTLSTSFVVGPFYWPAALVLSISVVRTTYVRPRHRPQV